MKYTPRQYALALRAVLQNKTAAEKRGVIRNFLNLLTRNRDQSKLEMILQETEKAERKERGLYKIELASPTVISPELKKGIKKAFGRKVIFEEKIDPDLLAGLKILIEDDTLIDATAKNQLNKLFSHS